MINKLKNRFLFVPCPENSRSLFDGKPCPTKDAYNILGKRGVKHLDKKIKQLIDYRVEMFGKRLHNSHGFPPLVTFLDTTKRRLINLISIEDGSHCEILDNKEFQDSSLYITSNYIIDVNNEYLLGDNDEDLQFYIRKYTDFKDELLEINSLDKDEIPEGSWWSRISE